MSKTRMLTIPESEILQKSCSRSKEVGYQMSPLHSVLRRERELRCWSQQDLVRQLVELCAKDGDYSPALTVKTVGRWERGEHKPSLYYRQRLCQLFRKNAIQLGFIE